MLVCDRYRFLFVHIPKTSGGAFRGYYRHNLRRWWWRKDHEVCRSHDPLTRELSEFYADYLKFAIVRNPWQLVASCYRFETKGVHRDKYGQLRREEIGLVEWLERKHASQENGDHPFPCQLAYIADEQGLLVDHICRQERLGEEMPHIFDRLGLKFDLKSWQTQRAHDYGHYDWREYFQDKRTRDFVAEICRDDIEYFNWKFTVD